MDDQVEQPEKAPEIQAEMEQCREAISGAVEKLTAERSPAQAYRNLAYARSLYEEALMAFANEARLRRRHEFHKLMAEKHAAKAKALEEGKES